MSPIMIIIMGFYYFVTSLHITIWLKVHFPIFFFITSYFERKERKEKEDTFELIKFAQLIRLIRVLGPFYTYGVTSAGITYTKNIQCNLNLKLLLMDYPLVRPPSSAHAAHNTNLKNLVQLSNIKNDFAAPFLIGWPLTRCASTSDCGEISSGVSKVYGCSVKQSLRFAAYSSLNFILFFDDRRRQFDLLVRC